MFCPETSISSKTFICISANHKPLVLWREPCDVFPQFLSIVPSLKTPYHIRKCKGTVGEKSLDWDSRSLPFQRGFHCRKAGRLLCAVCRRTVPANILDLNVCIGVDNHCSPRVFCLWVPVFPFSPLFSEPKKVNNSLQALCDSAWSDRGHPHCRS